MYGVLRVKWLGSSHNWKSFAHSKYTIPDKDGVIFSLLVAVHLEKLTQSQLKLSELGSCFTVNMAVINLEGYRVGLK